MTLFCHFILLVSDMRWKVAQTTLYYFKIKSICNLQEDAASGWDIDTVSESSSWVEEGLFAGIDALDVVDIGDGALKKD